MNKIKSLFSQLYIWVLVATIAGALTGYFAPDIGESLKPLGDGFISLVKVFIGPIIFCTIVTGIASGGNIKKVGRIGGKALVYFEVVSGFALFVGLVIANVVKPGAGFNASLESLDPSTTAQFAKKAADQSTISFILDIIPKTFVDAFTGSGNLLQVLLLALLFGWSLNKVGAKGKPALQIIESMAAIFFAIMNGIMKVAPIGAFGAMAFTVGKFGIQTLVPLASLIGTFYLTCVVFVILILGSIAAFVGFNIFQFLRYLRQEILLVLATSSSESALVPLMEKMERAGCSRSVVGIVVPSGYSFNLDGTNIYMTMAALFIAQAFNIDLTLGQQLSLLLVAALTSNGASGVTGSGFITLAATLAVVPEVPVAGMALILGVDRFMSEARAITNFIGNAVATVVISAWEKELDLGLLKKEIASKLNLGLGDPRLDDGDVTNDV
jgi:aerobic C4-dicarboxylate transport protein